MADGEAPKVSDLKARSISAFVMVAVAGLALWLGGWIWTLFVVTVGLGVLVEWTGLFLAFAGSFKARATWAICGSLYISVACLTLILLRNESLLPVLIAIGAVIGVDVGAYFSGRTFRGPKIAPAISPSKTWSGLAGGMLGASLVIASLAWGWPAGLCDAIEPRVVVEANHPVFDGPCSLGIPPIYYLFTTSILLGTCGAVVAQAGDFFESWMKRLAGVKDSGTLIPGHGGLFDRVDGLLAVCFTIGLVMLGTVLLALARGESLLPSPA